MDLEKEIKNSIKVWSLAIISLTYCYYVSSKLPIGILRLFSILPIMILFFISPLYLSSVHLCGITAFFLTWLGNSKLLLLAFDQGPLSPLPPKLLHFISIACLPIKIKQTPPPSQHKESNFDKIKQTPSPSQHKDSNFDKIKQNPPPQQHKDSNFIKTHILKSLSIMLFTIKCLLLVLVFQIHSKYKQFLSKNLILALNCCHMYLQGEIILFLFATLAKILLGGGFELEPQFNEPYLSTSLQDFWGRRWNLMVPTILRPTVYYPVRDISAQLVGPKLAPLIGMVSSFLVSGLYHELIYYYLTHVSPTWEVTWFFVLHGACTAFETWVKKRIKWRLSGGVSGPLTVGFLAVTGGWLFFPQMWRNGVVDKVINEDLMLYVKKLGPFKCWGARRPPHLANGRAGPIWYHPLHISFKFERMELEAMEFENEIKNLRNIWTLAIISMSYCYYIASKLPSGVPRLLSILPIISLFFYLPLNLSSIHLIVLTFFFLSWLGNSKLLLFAFDHGPLSPLPPKLLHFIFIACLPIEIKQNSSPPNRIGETRTPSSLLFAIKLALLGLLFHSHNYRQFLPESVVLALYCIHMYLEIEIILTLSAIPVRAIFGFELEPQFNEPYLTTSLQDFWGRRWNLMVPSILRPTVYFPVKNIATPVVGRILGQLIANISSFMVSGLFHELIYYYATRQPPTWEVTWFFVLHGVCIAVEIAVKQGIRWKLHGGISGPLTLTFLAATGWWLFFPQLLRNGAVEKLISEGQMLVSFVTSNIHTLKGLLTSMYK
ncbi:hypothetical protein ACFE04_023456 [Oxalis oulophora]